MKTKDSLIYTQPAKNVNKKAENKKKKCQHLFFLCGTNSEQLLPLFFSLSFSFTKRQTKLKNKLLTIEIIISK